MSKVFTVTRFDKGNLSLEMKMTLRKGIEGSSFAERKKYVQKVLEKDATSRKGDAYYVSWKDEFGCTEGYLVTNG